MFPRKIPEALARTAVAGAMLVAGLGAGQAHAAASYFGFADAVLALTGATPDDPGAADPGDLAFFFEADDATVEESTGSAFALAATAESASVIGPFTTATYGFSVFASVEGDAAAAGALAESVAGASSGYEIVVDNIGSTGYIIEGTLSYELDVEAAADDTSLEESAASAFIVLEGLAAGDLLSGLGTPTDVAAEASILAGPFNFDFASAGPVPVSFHVPAGGDEVLFFAGHADGFAEAVVPVPAAAWLFGSALLGLAGIGRRRR